MALALDHAKVTPHEMAEHAGVHINTVHAWLRGYRTPKVPALRVWAERTGVDPEYLLTAYEAERQEVPA